MGQEVEAALVGGAALLAIAWLSLFFRRFLDRRHALTLEDSRDFSLPRVPRLSVVVPACNEESTIGPALSSLLEQDYPDLEIVVINDRSTDRTGEILESMDEAGDERLKVLHLKELPPDWLGKNHALCKGSEVATGELLLFTDADVHFAPGALRLCVHSFTELELEHLVVAPRIETVGFWEKLMVTLFLVMFGFRFRPEIVHRDPCRFVGIGAFNMITREGYQAIGGHREMPLQVADDMMLGKVAKKHGLRQAAVKTDDGRVRVRWAIGFWGMVTGLEKNAYAGMDYSPRLALVATAALTIGGLGTVLGSFWGGWVSVGCALAWLFMGVVGFQDRENPQAPAWIGLCFPLASVVMAFILLRSAWLAEKRKGIYWRGTFYPLSILKKQPPLGYKLNQ